MNIVIVKNIYIYGVSENDYYLKKNNQDFKIIDEKRIMLEFERGQIFHHRIALKIKKMMSPFQPFFFFFTPPPNSKIFVPTKDERNGGNRGIREGSGERQGYYLSAEVGSKSGGGH